MTTIASDLGSAEHRDDMEVAVSRPVRPVAAIALLVLGVGLVLAPVAFDMFGRAPRGATMIGEFRPFMTATRLGGYQAEIGEINSAHREVDQVSRALFGNQAGSRTQLDRAFPEFAPFDRQWTSIDNQMTGLLTTVQDNLGNYQAVAALPSFKLFPWFFVVPGLIVMALALTMLRRPALSFPRWALLAVGIGLLLAPLAFQMFSRAPKGGQMMSSFRSIETTAKVESVQGYFGTISTGQGALRLEIVPALQARGLTESEIDSRFPGVARLDRDWIHILGDLTPMIGAMSDNVGNYQAVASLPPFPLFPWFFAIPGAAIALGAFASGRRRATGTDPKTRNRIDWRPA